MVPNGWSFGRVDNFFILQRGFDLTNKKRVEGTIPVYSSSGLAYYHNEVKVKGPGIVTGRKGSVGKVFMIEEDFWPHDTTLWVKDFKANDILYIKYFLDALKLERFDEASSVPTLNRNNVHRVQTVFPPLPEQRKIAQILSTWDRGIATTEKLIDASKQQKKALMQQLLTSKKRLVDPETGKAFEGEWEEVKLGDICDVKGGKRLPKGESLQTNANKHPYIRVTDMFMGGVDCTNLLYVPENIAPSIAKYTINSNDLFITVAGTLGIIGKIPSILDGANLTENADKLTNIKCNQIFLMYILMSPIIQQYIDSESTQNAQPKLALARIRSFSLLLPIDQEQQKIASVLIAADKEIELLKAKLAHFKQEKKALMQQLLTGKRRVSLSS
ncbi:restriction endonuclease subunit S [Photobacterium iliopiscarium]|nr:restriction endonuclease subunit S [Photobacterium iliopiscarium]